MDNYLGYSGLSERGNFMGGGGLILYLVDLLVAGHMFIQAGFFFHMDAVKIKKLNVRHLHCRHEDTTFCNVMNPWAYYFVSLGFFQKGIY